MAKIRLKKEKGVHHCFNRFFNAGEIYEVSNQEAFYLVNDQGVAEEVSEDSVFSKKLSVIPQPVPGQINIGMIRVGGIGDTLILAIQSRAVKRKYPNSFITLYVRDMGPRDIINCIESVDRVVGVGNKLWEGILDKVKSYGHDIIYDNRYITKVLYSESAAKRMKLDMDQTDLAFVGFDQFYSEFPLANNKLTDALPETTEIELMNQTACLDTHREDYKISLPPMAYSMSALLRDDKYVTIHNGADSGRQTKCWLVEYWETVVKFLIQNGYKVIQLGQRFEEIVPGAINMMARTTLLQTAGLIQGAQFHIDTEGGLVHLARMVGTRSVVLFAATPVSFFGYPENINIVSPSECQGCWWKTDMWWRDCPEGYPMPTKCMKELKPDIVINKLAELLNINKVNFPGEQLIPDKKTIERYINEASYIAEAHEWDKVYVMLEMLKENSKVLAIDVDEFTTKILYERGFDYKAVDVFDLFKMDVGLGEYDCVLIGKPINQYKSFGGLFLLIETVIADDGRIIFIIPMATSFDNWSVRSSVIYEENKFNSLVCAMKKEKA